MATIPPEGASSVDDFARRLDLLIAHLQTPGARAALLQALNSKPDELGQAAVAAAQAESDDYFGFTQ
jgi:hypothetical protein